MRTHGRRSARGGRALGPPLLALSILGAWGCGDAVLEAAGNGVREGAEAPGHGEVSYLRTRAEVDEAFAAGEAVLEPTQSFQAIELMVTLDGATYLEFQTRHLDGTWSEWRPVDLSDGDGPYRRGVLESERRSDALRLRGSAEIEFARFEFLAARPPEGAIGFHDDHHGEGHDDETDQAMVLKAAHSGRWVLPSAVRTASNRVNVPYSGAPSWNGGRNCSGSLTAGARALGDHLVANFRGARYFQGYSCRQIAGSSGMSLHGTGRAIDLFVPLDRGQADNDLGDPIAHWLIENAERIGIQLIIWDRSIWTGNRGSDKHRSYGGAHPHHDHLHIELTPAASRRDTPFFRGGAATPAPTPSAPPPAGQAGCHSQTLSRNMPHGACVQMAYESCGGRCKVAICNNGAWNCNPDAARCASQNPHNQCGGAPAPAPAPADPAPPAAPPPAAPPPAANGRACNSSTLGRSVPDGECVQMSYESCGGTCRWARCDDGGWSCTPVDGCGAVLHNNGRCAAPNNGRACYSRTLGRDVANGQRVQMAYDACGGSCQWAVCANGDWQCTAGAGDGARHPHARCN